jgi:hypothetical protein
VKHVLAAVVLSLAVAAPQAAAAQTGTAGRTVDELVLNDGSRVFGSVEYETNAEIVFKTTAGAAIRAPRDKVASIRRVSGRMVNGEFQRDDPNDTRLLFGPTGRALPKGQVYLGVYDVLMPFMQVGITDRISIGGGTPLIFNTEDWDRLYWITPKVQLLSRNGTHVAAGVFHGFDSNDHAGIAYGVVTKDAGSGSVTAGAGIGYASESGNGGVAMFGAEAPLRRNLKFVTENYIWKSSGIVSGGVRFFGEHLSADLAVGIIMVDSPVAFPIVNFVYRF